MVVENKTVLEGNKVKEDLITITKKSFIPRWITILFLFVLTVLIVIITVVCKKRLKKY